MKRILIALVLVTSVGCRCAAEKRVVIEVEDSQKLVVEKFREYVKDDPKLDAAQKDDWEKLIASMNRALEALKNALK